MAPIEDLKEEFENVGVGFFDFVEQDDGVGPTTNGFGEHAAFAVADVSGGRAFQGGNGMGFLELAHVNRDHVALSTVKEVGEGERGFGFADAGGADEHEDADGFVGVFHLGLGDLDALGDGIESVVLTDDALRELRGEVEGVLDFVFEHFADRDAGPGRDDFADGLAIEADAHERIFTLEAFELFVHFGEFFAHRSELFGGVNFGGFVFNLTAEFAHFEDDGGFLFKAGFDGGEIDFGGGEFFGDGGQTFGVVGADGLFASEDAMLDFKIVEATAEVFDGGGRRVLAEREFGAGGVKDADGFVRELATGDVAMGEADGGFEAFIEDAHLMMLFEHADDAAHHDHADFFGRFFDLDDLEAAGEGGILFKVLLVLAPGGGGDGAHFATGEGGLQEIGGITLTGLATGTDHGVGFVDEEDDGFGAGLHLFDEALETIFELAFDAGPSLEEGEIERVEFDVFQ